MLDGNVEWLPLDVAASRFGYGHKESLRRRLRQLRKQGYVVDLGKPPSVYLSKSTDVIGKVVVFWPNSKTALLHSDAPEKLLDPRRGRRRKFDRSRTRK
jgi:hypothetical protein